MLHNAANVVKKNQRSNINSGQVNLISPIVTDGQTDGRTEIVNYRVASKKYILESGNLGFGQGLKRMYI